MVVGLKANVSEAEHPLLCEGTRRQRGELAVSMIVHYKDDQHKLSKVSDVDSELTIIMIILHYKNHQHKMSNCCSVKQFFIVYHNHISLLYQIMDKLRCCTR